MNTIKFQNDTYILPGDWNEITTPQLELLSKIISGNVYPVNLKVKLALSLMGMRLHYRKPVYINDQECFYIRHGWRNVYLVNSLQVNDIASCLDFILDDNKIQSKLTKNPYTAIEFRFKRFFGPGDCLSNLKFGEFIAAEVERDLYQRTNNISHFNRMLAILWRPTCWKPSDSDLRAPLRMDGVEKRARQIAKLPMNKRMAMQWFYDGCLDFLYEKFSNIFTQGGSSESSAFESFMKMVNMLSDNKLFNVDATREAYLYDALYTLQNIIETYEKQKQ